MWSLSSPGHLRSTQLNPWKREVRSSLNDKWLSSAQRWYIAVEIKVATLLKKQFPFTADNLAWKPAHDVHSSNKPRRLLCPGISRHFHHHFLVLIPEYAMFNVSLVLRKKMNTFVKSLKWCLLAYLHTSKTDTPGRWKQCVF